MIKLLQFDEIRYNQVEFDEAKGRKHKKQDLLAI